MAKLTGADETPENKSKTPPADQDYQAALATKEVEIGELEKRIQGLGGEINALTLKNTSLEEEKGTLEDNNKSFKDALDEAGGLIILQNDRIKNLQDTAENYKAVIAEFENKPLGKLASNTSIQKDEVHAVKGSQERTFPRLAWDSLSKDKNGWQIKVEIPKEAQ